MSSVHYISGALATALGVLSLGGHNGCIQGGNLKPALATTVPWV
jgi:hypothetical protein